MINRAKVSLMKLKQSCIIILNLIFGNDCLLLAKNNINSIFSKALKRHFIQRNNILVLIEVHDIQPLNHGFLTNTYLPFWTPT